MKQLFLTKFLPALFVAVSVLSSCSKDHVPEEAQVPALAPSERLASTAWSTTGARNEKGEAIALNDPRVAAFVGLSYFKMDGTFTIFSMDTTPKTRGTWSVTADGKSRTLVTPAFTRTVEITVLNGQEFTYRLYPEPNDNSKYIDIIHTPTRLSEPPYLTPTGILASTAWSTTGARNEKDERIALTDPSVVGMVGSSSFNINGAFTIFNLDESPRVSGTWSISPDGKARTLVTPTFTRTVEITVLTKSEFTYRVYPVTGNTGIYLDIIHTPVIIRSSRAGRG